MLRPLACRARNFVGAFIKDPLAHWPFIQLSRQLCGNTAGAKQNLYGGLQLAYYRLCGVREGKKSNDPWVERNVKALKRDGILKIEAPIVSLDTIELIRRKFDEKIKISPQSNEYFISFGAKDIVHDIPEVFAIFDSQTLRDLIQEFFNSAYHIDQITYRRTFHVPIDVRERDEVYSNYWHCDSSPISELALFINLKDIDSECGPTMVVDKGHSSMLIRKYYSERANRETIGKLDAALESGGYAQAFTGPAGSMLFTQSTKCLHRASIPEEGRVRDWLSFRFLPKNAPIIADRVVRNPILKYTHGLRA
jgi:hypothetical protein